MQLFEQAVAIDAEFALGWAGLADALSLLADYGLARPAETIPRAKSAAMLRWRRDFVESGLCDSR